MTIRARLTAAVALTALVVLALSALALVSASDGRRLIHQPQEQFDALNDVNAFGLAVARAMQEINDVGSGRDDFDELDDAMATARNELAAIEEAARRGQPRDREQAAELRAIFDRLDRARDHVIVLVAAGDDEGIEDALEILGEEIYERDFLAVLARATAGEHQHLAATVRAGEHSADRTRQLALGLAGLGLVVVGFVVMIVWRIQRRLTGLTTVVARMGGGALDARTTDVVAGDELGDLGREFNGMAGSLERTIATAAEKEALAQELALAARMQHAILPPVIAVPGLEIAAVMMATAQIGGDYYDVQPTEDGAWIGIGDVSGHGFNAGVVMIMAQSTIATCVRALPDAGPAEILGVVNRVLYENVRTRLGLREHMTMSLLRYRLGGRIVYAGAHQELLIRGVDGVVRELPTVGPWLGLVADVRPHLVEREVVLGPGESLLLFTDGVTEARTPAGPELGLEGLAAVLAAAPDRDGVERQCAAILGEVTAGVAGFDDDVTLVVVRRPAGVTVAVAA